MKPPLPAETSSPCSTRKESTFGATREAVVDLADALVGLRHTLGPDISASVFVPYLEAMCALAEKDFETNKHLVTDAASAAVGATLGTVLWEPILLLLRRIAHEHVAVRTFGRKGTRG